MRTSLIVVVLASLIVGCQDMGTYHSSPADPETRMTRHPTVEIQGNDGTVLRGELMNGSVTIDCDQGQLTLLTDHIRSITFSPESDTVDSQSIKVSGKIMEGQFQLRSEHGVFTLLKERLRRIDFRPDGFTTPIETTAPTTRQSRAIHRDASQG